MRKVLLAAAIVLWIPLAPAARAAQAGSPLQNGEQLFQQGRFAEARKLLEQALAIYRRDEAMLSEHRAADAAREQQLADPARRQLAACLVDDDRLDERQEATAGALEKAAEKIAAATCSSRGARWSPKNPSEKRFLISSTTKPPA